MKYKTKYMALKDQMEYPYYKYAYDGDITKDFKQLVFSFSSVISDKILVPTRQRLLKYKNRFLIIEEEWDKNEELNNVTDYFTEQYRVKCNVKNYISPYDYWQKNKDVILQNNESIKKIRDYMYNNTKLCNNFRISVALTVLNIFRPKSWLDISAGWGDRLVSAIGYGIDYYCGVDPNENLHNGYNDIINTLDPDGKNKYNLIKGGFENAKLPNMEFDIVFTSPPFFDYEIYSDNAEDSVVINKTADDWYNNFLMVSINKAYKYLKKGGHMILYISDITGTSYVDRMVNDTKKFMKYEGIIYYHYKGAKTYRPMHVFSK